MTLSFSDYVSHDEPTMSPSFDYQPLIHRNCYVFLGPDADIDVVTQKDDSGQWHAHVLKTEDSKRTALLSAASGPKNRTPHHALELLHEKTARAVDQYVLANGFALPPKLTTTRPSSSEAAARQDDDDDDDVRLPGFRLFNDPPSQHTLGFSSDEDESVASDDSRGTSRSRYPRQRRRVPVKAANIRPSQSDDAGETHNSSRFRIPHLAVPRPSSLNSPRVPPTGPPNRFQPLPPPGWKGPNSRVLFPPPPPPPPPPPATAAAASSSSAAAPPGFPIPSFPPRLPLKLSPPQPKPTPVRLNITWLGHGEKKLLVQCAPTEQQLCQRALMEVRLRASRFANLGPGDTSPARLCNLRAVVLRARIGDEPYELSGFGEDLSKLCGVGGGGGGVAGMIPGFDVEVSLWKAPTGPEYDSDASLSDSDGEIIDA